jgi:hypothetical protein
MNRHAWLPFLFALLLGAGVAHAADAPAAAPTTTPRPVLTEAAKINALIGSVEAMPNAVFIRNGSEYTASRAAEHLRLKWRNAGGRVRTAEQFIKYCASESSLTGRKYKIRFPDGRTVDSGVFFHEQLARIEAGKPLVLPPGKPAPKR